MGTRSQIVDFILEQMSGVRDVSARKMFGEFAIYSTGKVVALVCDDQLFVKPTEPGKRFIGRVTEGAPYPGAKPCFLVDGARWEDGDWLSELIRLTANALPVPKAKSAPRPARARSGSETRKQARPVVGVGVKRKASSKDKGPLSRKASSKDKAK
ncbi:MAG: TfoX/Sxy family protein [Pseudomonadota bacterium]